MSGSLLLHTVENPKCVSFFFCQWTKIKCAFMFHKRAKAKSNNPGTETNYLWIDQRPKASRLLWSGAIWQRERGGKARSLAAHMHTLCMESKHGRETFKALAWFKTTETLCHARPSLGACWQSQHCLCDTHRCRRCKTGSRRPPRLCRRRITRRSCLRIGRSGQTPASSITFFLLILLVSARWQTQKFSCFFFPVC